MRYIVDNIKKTLTFLEPVFEEESAEVMRIYEGYTFSVEAPYLKFPKLESNFGVQKGNEYVKITANDK